MPDSNSSSTTLSGGGTPGASLRVLDPVHPASSLCTPTVAGDGSWSCSAQLSSGANQTLTVRDLTDTQFPDVTSATFSVLTAPAVTTGGGVVVGARLAGTGYPGATVTLSFGSSASSASTTVAVASSGSWQTVLPAAAVPSGSYTLLATQSSSAIPRVPVSSSSAPLGIVIDREAPSAPVVLDPSSGSTVSQQPFVFDGTGETGATVTTYVDSNPVCTAQVTAGQWSCSTTGLLIPDGTRSVQAAQVDPAGNYGPPSTGVAIVFATAGTGASPSPQSSPSPTSKGRAPSPTATASPSTAPAAPGSGGGSSGSGPTGSGGTAHGGSGSIGGGADGSGGSSASSGMSNAEAAASWTASTGFGRNLPTLSQSLSGWSWPISLLLGLIFAVLIIAPTRLVSSTLRGSRAWGTRLFAGARRVTGRNRARTDDDDSPVLSPASTLALTIAGGAVIVALSIGVDNQLRYVRLLLAIVLGLVALNGLAVVVPTWILGRRLGLVLRLRVSPRMLAVAALACLVTRLFSLDPPMVLGVLLAAGLTQASAAVPDTAVLPDSAAGAASGPASGAAARPTTARGDETGDARARVRLRGILATVQLASLTLVSFVAWVLHGLVPAASSQFGVEVLREGLATVCLAGLGSLIVLLIPLGALPGRFLWAWSRSTLVGLAVVGVAAAGVVLGGDPQEAFPIMPLVAAAVVFAALAVAAWVWARYVEPVVDDA
ncbi:hypothetical protein GCM10025780_13950 [Frondihabitans cladoniiphilus]|uniref:Bacterial Ig-like domain-containing protein n=1 Tax=Frondihabitans cladoniiphilus TaxID=715785 RepID=A0ABP8VTP6_9MICO